MGEILDVTAALVFLCLVVPKTVIISKLTSISIPRRFLWKASIVSFTVSLVSLLITALASLPVIVGIAYDVSSSRWLQSTPFIIGYFIITISPGLFFEKHILSKGGVDKSIALKISVLSHLYMVLTILALALFFYITAMKYF